MRGGGKGRGEGTGIWRNEEGGACRAQGPKFCVYELLQDDD